MEFKETLGFTPSVVVFLHSNPSRLLHLNIRSRSLSGPFDTLHKPIHIIFWDTDLLILPATVTRGRSTVLLPSCSRTGEATPRGCGSENEINQSRANDTNL